jgi:hypothetical protein
MDIFYTTVLSIALVILILILTYVGIMLSYSNTQNSAYPPTANVCPDYWLNAGDGSGCIVPDYGTKNSGDLLDKDGKATSALTSTHGYSTYQSKPIIKFSDPSWGKNGISICDQQEWADKHKIVWDGVSNYNSCANKSSK